MIWIGVTALKGTGMYTGKDRVLMCVLYRAQILK